MNGKRNMTAKNVLLALFLLLLTISALLATVIFYSKFLLSVGMGEMLGARVTIGHLMFDPKNNDLSIKDFMVYNPKGFDVEAMLAEIPEITGKFNPKSLLIHRKFHIPVLNIYIKTLAIIKNKKGELNIDKLKITQTDLNEMPVEIDRLIFSTDDVVYKDYTKGDKPRVEIYNVNIKDRSYDNIPSVDQVATKILVDSLGQTAIKGAAILGIATVAAGSVAAPVVVPVAAASILFSGRDTYYANFERTYDDVYKAALRVAGEMSDKVNENKQTGIISGSMDSATVTIKIVKESGKETHVAVTARKLLVPKPRIAGGILYEISDKLQEIKPSHKK